MGVSRIFRGPGLHCGFQATENLSPLHRRKLKLFRIRCCTGRSEGQESRGAASLVRSCLWGNYRGGYLRTQLESIGLAERLRPKGFTLNEVRSKGEGRLLT